MMKLRNLTPHPIVLRVDGKDYTLPPDGDPPRVETVSTPAGTLPVLVEWDAGDEVNPARGWDVVNILVPLLEEGLGEVVGLPVPEEGTILIVSQIVARIVARDEDDWHDLVYPAELIRDDTGRVVAAGALARPRR